ncbi:PaaI family thioesterase [Glycomyces albus]
MTDELREAVAALGAQVRRLNEAAVRAVAEPEALRRLADRAGELAAELEKEQRPLGVLSELDDLASGQRAFSPVTGDGNPVAPPVPMERIENGARGRFTLGASQEGPPGFAHGGVTALILDEFMGWTAGHTGNPAMTVGLQLSYAQPVPLGVPLEVEAVLAGRNGRTILVEGRIAAEADREAPMVEAEGTFIELEADQIRSLFPDLAHLL